MSSVSDDSFPITDFHILMWMCLSTCHIWMPCSPPSPKNFFFSMSLILDDVSFIAVKREIWRHIKVITFKGNQLNRSREVVSIEGDE